MKRATAISFAQALAAAGTVEEVDSVIHERLPAVLDALAASLAIIDPDAREVRLQPSDIVPREIAERYGRLPLDAANPLAEVVRTRAPLILRGDDDWRARAPKDLCDAVAAAGIELTMCVPLAVPDGEVLATLTICWDDPDALDDATRATVGTVTELCVQTLERARTTDRMAHHAMHLARLAEQLADALTVDEALDIVTVAGRAPVGAQHTSIGLVDETDGVLRVRHGPTVPDEVRERYVDPALDARLAFTDAARTGEAIYIEDYDTYLARYPEGAATTGELGFGARAALPICTAEGALIGAIVHAWPGPRTFGSTLRSALTTISDMAGQAIERARLVEQIRRHAARSSALAELAELLATARTSDDVADVVSHHAARVIGSDSADVALLDPASGRLLVRQDLDVAPTQRDRYREVPLDASQPHVDAVRDGGLLVFEDLDTYEARYPHLVDDLKAQGRSSCAIVALPDSRGEPLGAIGFAWTERTRIDDDARAALEGVADLCARALERAGMSDAEHRLVKTLQENVLAPLPPMAGIDTAARHLPAARHIGMGGDWYQGIELDDHRYAVIVGDVAGHGLTAVGEMAQLRAVTGALVMLGVPLQEVFRQATTLLRSADHMVTATAVVAVVDTSAETVAYVSAGHPPPLLRTPDGSVLLLTDGRQPLLGVPAEAAVAVGSRTFGDGSTLILYTDGLVERRGEPLDESIERLRRGVEERTDAGGTADELASQLLATHVEDRDPDDDVAIVVVTRRR